MRVPLAGPGAARVPGGRDGGPDGRAGPATTPPSRPHLASGRPRSRPIFGDAPLLTPQPHPARGRATPSSSTRMAVPASLRMRRAAAAGGDGARRSVCLRRAA